MWRSRAVVLALALAAAQTLASGARAASYAFQTFDDPLLTLPHGDTRAFGINDQDQVVGFGQDGNGRQAFLLSGGVFMNPSAAAGVTLTNALGINNAGTIVGQTDENVTPTHGYILTGDSISYVDFPAARQFTVINAINNKGDLAGTYDVTPGSLDLAFFRIGDAFLTFADPESASSGTFGTGINDNDQAVFFTGNATSYLYSGGSLTALQPGFIAMGLNNAGDIVGWRGHFGTGVVYSGGVYTDILVPGSATTIITGINNDGDIVGYYQNFLPGTDVIDASTHGFLGIRVSDGAPVPEPSTWGLMVAGFLGVGFALRRRGRGVVAGGGIEPPTCGL